MLDYILIEPKDSKDKDESYKFPFVSQQILSSQASQIVDFFFPPRDNWRNSTGSMIYINIDEKENKKEVEKTKENDIQNDIQNDVQLQDNNQQNEQDYDIIFEQDEKDSIGLDKENIFEKKIEHFKEHFLPFNNIGTKEVY